MNERHFNEIERVMLNVSHARERALKAAKLIGKDGADPHLVAALERAGAELAETHRALMQGTYFAVLDAQEQLALKR